MTGQDLLVSLSFVEDRFVEDAERTPVSSGRRIPMKKALLIAAVIAVMLTLVGCAVAYVMHMKDFQVGQQEATRPVYSGYGIAFSGYEPVQEKVLTLGGLEGSPNFQAAKEWYEYKQAYDPDHRIIVTLMQENKVPEFPAEYDAYNIYSQEMKDKLDEILKEYALKPVGELLDFRRDRYLYEALGVDSFLNTEGTVTVTGNGGGCYENGNFWLNLDFQVPTDGESQVERTTGVLQWNRKDCFSEDLITIQETGDWEEWNYTMASGRKALILRSPSDWHGWIICDRGSAILSLWVGARQDVFTNDGEKDVMVSEYMSDRQLEAIAEAIDQGIKPCLVTREDVENQPQPPNEATQGGYTLELKKIETDGYAAHITLAITAPEGTDITHSFWEGQEGEILSISPGSLDICPVSEETGSFSTSWLSQEDGDGKDNTQNVVICALDYRMDGSMPFAPGSQWTMRIMDLETNWWNTEEMYLESKTLAEGEWTFSFPIQETDGDFREVEMLSEPITAKAFIGTTMEGKHIVEDREMTSLKLRKYSAAISCEDTGVDFLWIDYGTSSWIVMKDGSRVRLLAGMNEHEPIDLSQVAYVLLADGTKIPMPE